MVKREVDKIVDGDTFTVTEEVEGSRYIRITEMDAPEKGQPGYDTATQKLREQIEGKTVDVVPKGKSYGRTVAEVKVDGKQIK